ncbi:phosphohydrolase [Paraburkholderia sp. BCC1885]|uniref:phosphohydrolase n=1 Tax=Paraburkholderia sp. BCC1885 TaxID=2562669 RepID=UPI0021B4A0E2|nr:phosphohydrolase [Paraburkholderia sp. BCC1885]
MERLFDFGLQRGRHAFDVIVETGARQRAPDVTGQGEAMTAQVAGVAIPDSELARRAIAFVEQDMPRVLIGHAFRVFLFASLIGRHRMHDFSEELLFVAAVFHHHGLAPRFGGSNRRFELDSADAAFNFLKSHGIAEQEVRNVWYAITLHSTFGLDGFDSPLVGLLHAGVETDLMALHFDEISDSDRAAVVRAYPRERAFKALVIDALADGMTWRPETTFGNVNADVMERCNPDYSRINFCGLILGSQWDE